MSGTACAPSWRRTCHTFFSSVRLHCVATLQACSSVRDAVLDSTVHFGGPWADAYASRLLLWLLPRKFRYFLLLHRLRSLPLCDRG